MEAVRVMLKRSLLGIVVIAGVVFIAVMLQILFQIFPWSLDALNFTRDRAEWPSVQGTIALASDRNTQGYVSVSFEYQIKDATYFTVQRWAADQPGYFKGQKVTVHYDPLNPNVAVVNTSKSEMPLESSIIVIIIGLIALGALAGIVVWACWGLDLPGLAAVALGLGVDYFKYRSLGIVFWIMVGIAALPVRFFWRLQFGINGEGEKANIVLFQHFLRAVRRYPDEEPLFMYSERRASLFSRSRS